MSTTPAVSICCITYNHAKYIRDALEGFLMQKTNFPIEILIHDDASTDGTADIIRKYEAKHPDIIKPIYQTENQYSQGKDVSSFNFDRVQGKYIALCEGDDFWTDPDKLQIQYDFMESHPDYSLHFHKARIKNEINSSVIGLYDSCKDADYSGETLLASYCAPTASIFCRKDLLKYLPESKRFPILDIVLILTMWSHGKIRGSSRVMSVYRKQPGGVTNSSSYKELSEKNIRHHLLYFGKMLYYFPKLDSDFVRKCTVKAFLQLLSEERNHFGSVRAFRSFRNLFPFKTRLAIIQCYCSIRFRSFWK